MATLQNSLISLQPKIPNLPTLRSLNLSFSATFPSLKFTGYPQLRSRGGAKMSTNAAASYATALADLAINNHTLASTADDVEKIEKVFSNPQVLSFFANPIIDIEKKRSVLDEIAKASDLQLHSKNFLNLLVDSKRINLITEIVKQFELVYNRLTDTQIAVVSSVVQLEEVHLAQLAKQVQKLTKAKNVRMKTVIDPSLVAGFTVRYGGSGSKLIDMSVKKQLEDLALELDFGDIQLAGTAA